MLKAKDFRKYAREALAGRWLKAGVVGLVAGLLGGTITTGTSSGSWSNNSESTEPLAEQMAAFIDANPMILAWVLGILLVLVLWLIVILVIGGATTLGYAKYNLNLVDNNEPKMRDIFSQYNRFGTGFGMQFFRGLYTFLWTLLFVIPGIIAGYSYSMTPFILCENPGMKAREAISESKALMKGNKWRLFCLQLSFIGWEFLALAVLGGIGAAAVMSIAIVGSGIDTTATLFTGVLVGIIVIIVYSIIYTLVLSPYVTAAMTVFYREISEERYSAPQIEVEEMDYTYECVPEKKSDDIIEYIEF